MIKTEPLPVERLLMLFSRRAATPENPRRADEERRNASRHETAVVGCSLGDLKDLSRTGARAACACRTPPPLGVVVMIELRSPAESVSVSARVVRVRQIARGRWDIGLRFEDVSAELAESIESLAKHGTTRSPARGAASREQARKLIASLSLPDHYKALGVGATASAEEIQRAFRAMARAYHPDVNKDADAAAVFCALSEAHHVLGDADKRGEYDRLMGFVRAA